MLSSKLFFDYYAASFDVPRETFYAAWRNSLSVISDYTLEPCKPRHGYNAAERLIRSDFSVFCTILYNGTGSDGFHVFASGDSSEQFYRFCCDSLPDGRLTRADVAVDFDELGSWQSLYSMSSFFEARGGYKRRYIGPADKSTCQQVQDGRTVYVGSRSSSGMLRIYEKGKKDDFSRPDWVRVELELKPQNLDARKYLYCADALQCLSAHNLGRYFLEVFESKKKMPVPLSRIEAKLSEQKAFEHMCKQYKKVLRWKLEQHSGSPDLFFSDLMDFVLSDD